MLGQLEAQTTAPAEPPSLPEYWQVSRADHPFGDELEIPRGQLLPFPAPEEVGSFTEEEVIEIVDFARTRPHAPREGPNVISVPERLSGSLPVHEIKRDGGVIEVWTGAQEDFLAGSGEILRCRKKDDGSFEVLSISQWVS